MISFVVPAHNEEQLLDRTLSSLREAAAECAAPCEIIVVDDSSSDETAAIAAAQGATVVSVHVRQIARARNAGAAVAHGELLIFVDADTLVSPDTLRATLAAVRAGAIAGGARLEFEGPLAPWTLVGRPAVNLLMRVFRLAPGCYFFCTRAAFDSVGGFDERLFAAEEIALSRALHRHGRFVVLREAVISSGRKLRRNSGWVVLRLALSLAWHGTKVLRSRDRLAVWYGPRRNDGPEG